MQRAPYPDPDNPADTYAGALLDSSATVSVWDVADPPPAGGGGGGGGGAGATQQAVCYSTADAAPGVVQIRNLFSSAVCNVAYYVHPVDDTPTAGQIDLGENAVPPDGWFERAFTGSGAEALSDPSWIQPVAFVSSAPEVAPLVANAAQVLPGVQLTSGREEGHGYPLEMQLIRHHFVMPTFDQLLSAELTLYAKGLVLSVLLNDTEIDRWITVTFDAATGTSLVSGSVATFLEQGVDNVLAICYAGTWAGSGAAGHFLPTPVLARTQFIGYQIVVTS
jgi:hypothetical protein